MWLPEVGVKNIIAIGGGHLGEHRDTYDFGPDSDSEFLPWDTRSIDELVIESTGKPNPRVLVVATAREDSPRHDIDQYLDAFTSSYESLGASVERLQLLPKVLANSDIERRVAAADAVYVSGGNTKRMIATWKRYGLGGLLQKAYDSGTVMSGLSAGSIAWFAYGNSNSHYSDKPFRVTALGWFPAIVCPHYDVEPFRQEPFKKMVKQSGMVGLAIDETAAIQIVNDTDYRVLSSGGQATVSKCSWKQNEYFVEPLAPGSSGKLADLLSA